MKNILKKSFVVFLLCLITSSASAHSGRTNGEGCHNNKKTGDYHCHNDSEKSAKTESRTESKDESRTEARSSIICSFNYYNCSDFVYKTDAQETYEYCLTEEGSDIHDLDRDNDGDACENLK